LAGAYVLRASPKYASID